MTLINLIEDGDLTIMQGAQGIALVQESWVVEKEELYKKNKKFQNDIVMEKIEKMIL